MIVGSGLGDARKKAVAVPLLVVYFFKDIFMCMSTLLVCMGTTCILGACRGQKRASVPPELE